MDGWNVEFVAGLVVGYLCPQCQTPQEDLEAELSMITGRSDIHTVTPGSDGYFVALIHGLVNGYPTPEIMRDKANQLERARTDAAEIVRLMRRVADDMESGELWETA